MHIQTREPGQTDAEYLAATHNRLQKAEAEIDRIARGASDDVPGFLLKIAVARMGAFDSLRELLEAHQELLMASLGLDPNEVTTDRLEAAFEAVREELS